MLELLQQYQYIFLFVGVIVGGEMVIIPAVYLTLTHVFNFPLFISITIFATIISDSVWYVLGRVKNWEQLKKYSVFSKREELTKKFVERFNRHALKYLFVSKFVYGTRIIAQVLSGVRKVPYYKYIIVNSLAILTWISFIVIVGFALNSGFDRFKQTVGQMQVFIFFVIIIITSSIWLSKIIKKKW